MMKRKPFGLALVGFLFYIDKIEKIMYFADEHFMPREEAIFE